MTKSLAIFRRFSHQSTLFHHPACLFLKRKASSSGLVSPVGGLSRMSDRPPRYAFTCRYGRPGKPSSQCGSAAFHGGEKSFCSVARTAGRNTTFRLPSAGPKAARTAGETALSDCPAPGRRPRVQPGETALSDCPAPGRRPSALSPPPVERRPQGLVESNNPGSSMRFPPPSSLRYPA